MDSQPSLGRLSFGQQSIYQVAKELKKEQHTLYNCLASILSDAAFIQEIRLLYPDVPLLANLRAGGWYTPSPDGTCYFKSTDGHQNNCNFSVTRLNWHVAELAAQKGGVMVVDATRKGKRFPDAMSKTIPIWAAVLNRAVARVRAYDAQKAQRRRTYAAANGEVFTAVTDTQTMVPVRSVEVCGPSSSAGSSGAAVQPAAAAAGAGACTGTGTQYQQAQLPNMQVVLNTQQQGMTTQEHQQAPEQPRGQYQHLAQQSGSLGSHTPSIDGSTQAASAVPNCECGSNSPQVVQLLVDCLGPSMDLMSGLSSTGDSGAAAGAAQPAATAAASLQPCSNSSAAGTAGVGGCAGPPCCCLHRSKSVHISPQPSLHEWLDEMDVLRRLSLMAETRAALRPPPRVSCPASCARASRPEGLERVLPLPNSHLAACAGSAPAVSCLLATAEEEAAPATPAAAYCAPAQFVDDVSAFAEAGACAVGPSRCNSPVAARLKSAGASADVDGPPSAPLTAVSNPAVSRPAVSSAPALQGLGSPGFLLSAGHAAGPGSDSAGEPLTPRLMFGTSTGNSSSRSSSGEELLWEPVQAVGEEAQKVVVTKQLRFADDAQSDASSDEAVPGDFAFPPPHQLAASAGSSVGAEAAGHLAASGAASSGGSSCDSGLVRLPDMPVVVLNGTSHQPGDAASILDIWRGTDLEDVACLPGISDFRPGVYHLPEGAQPRDLSIDDDWPAGQQQQQPQLQPYAAMDSACVKGCSNDSKCATSWAAEVCLRSQQQLSGRVSVSNWLDDDETGAACDALCAFAVPAMPPSCASTTGSADAADEAAASCHSVAGEGSQSGSACSEDSRPSSRQSSNTTAGFSSGGAIGGPLAETSSMGSGCLAAAVDAAAVVPLVQWDTSLHLPLWVSSHEREAIEAKLDGWVERLLEVGADVRGLAAVLTKPLRPLWVSQSSLIWTNQVANPSSLPFTPLLLVSASQPHAGERQAVKAAWLSLAKGTAGSPERPLTPGLAAALSDSDSGDDSSDDSDFDDAGLGCSWGSNRSRKASRHMLRGSLSQKQRKRSSKGASSKSKAAAELGSWSYMYVPGAGDDEESWAAGLTPALFWQHCDALLRCGPNNIKPAVKQLLQLHKSASFGGATASLAAAAIRGLAATPPSSSSSNHGRPLSPLGRGSTGSSGFHADAGAVPAVLTDEHHHAPQGCAPAGGVSLHVVPAAPGAFWVGNTGLAVGNLEGASAADVWRAVDAVLCFGTAMVPVLQGEYNAMRLAAARVPATPAAPISSSAPTASAWLQQQRSKSSEKPLSCSLRTSSSAAHSHWVRQQQELAVGAADSTVAADQMQPSLEFSKVSGAPARKPARKNGMLSTLLSKAGVSAPAACPATGAPAAAVQPAAELQHAGSYASSDASSVCSSSYYSVCSEDGLAAGAGTYSAASSKSALPRLKWLPVESCKRDRSSLKQHLQEALEFVSAHLAAGHTILLHDVEGHDNCVCLAVAVLSGCFAVPSAAAADTRSGAPEPVFAGAWQPDSQQDAERACAAPQLPAAPVSKQSVRQQLALVSGCYPLARPTRGMLKQVFNFFEERKRETSVQ